MRVALIAPPYPLEEAPSPPLGICYVAAVFEASGADVKIFDYIVRGYSPEKLKKEMDEFKPDVVGTNSVTMNFYGAAGILRTAKLHNPSVITIMGGPHVSFDYERTLKAYPEIDLIVIGEGEATLEELIPAVFNRSLWKNIKGIAYIEDGITITTGKREFIKNLETLPLPARHLLPVSRYLALGYPVSIITSRGCPNRCIFCQGRRMVGMKVRYRSIKSVADEIEDILSYGFPRINIADDFFTSNKKRVKLICDEIMNRGLKFSWSAFARVDSCDKEAFESMVKAGCDTVSFGIESGNQEMLDRIQKGITLDQARNAVKICREVGLGVFLSFMAGLPGETKKTLNDTEAFAKELNVPFGYHYLAPFPGTTLREELDKFDLEVLTDDWDQYDANRAITRTSQLTRKQINEFVGQFDKEIEKCWEDMKKRYPEGKCSDAEKYKIEGDFRMRLIFQLLKEDVIEMHGFYIDNASSNNCLPGLVKRLSHILGLKAEDIEDPIADMVKSGYLNCQKDKSAIEWFWTHNLKNCNI